MIQAEDYRYQTAEIDGHTFIVSQSGSIQRNDTEYKEDGEVLIDAKPQRAADGTDLYRIEFVTEENQWRYSIDEEASVGSLKDYTGWDRRDGGDVLRDGITAWFHVSQIFHSQSGQVFLIIGRKFDIIREMLSGTAACMDIGMG